MLKNSKVYLQVKDSFAEHKKKYVIGLIIFFLLILVIIVLSVAIKGKKKQENDLIDGTTKERKPDDNTMVEEWDGSILTNTHNEEMLTGEMIYMPCFETYYEVDSKTYINLGNEKDNNGTIYLEYVVRDSDEIEIYRSELIKVGEAIPWNPSEYLPEGENEIILMTNAYKKDGDNLVYKTFLVQQLTIKIV